ncbi:MAG TPA: cytochrome P450 [Polyangiales bacterium]|nr:cytochrome P450 [Polyangiales bacterium]
MPGASGTWSALANMFSMMRQGSAHLNAQVRQFGPVYKHMMGPTPIVCVSDADLLVRIARNEDKAWSTALAYRELFAGVMPGVQTVDFLTTFDFDLHRDVRKVLQPAFSPAALASYVDIAAAAYEPAIESWLRHGAVRFKPAVRRLFADVAGRIFMGIDDAHEAKMLDVATANVWQSLTTPLRNAWLSPTWSRALRGYRTLQAELLRRVPERRERAGSDLFSRLCQASGDTDLLDDEGVVRLFIGIMLAAFDTTSLGVASMGYLLATQPAWQERLREEGARGTWKELEQHEWVWKETLRMYPVASGIPRVTLRDVQLAGYRVPARTMVLCFISPALQDPSLWTQPQRFDPERFSPQRAEDKRHRAAFLAFGSGAHTCIGMQLANLESKVFWRALLSRASIRLAKPYRARHQFAPLGSVSGEVDLVLQPRQSGGCRGSI